MHTYLDFEKPVADLEGKVEELKAMQAEDAAVDVGEEIARLESKAQRALTDLYAKLTPWQKTQIARHPDRPHFKAYTQMLFTDYTPLAGDRGFADDHAIQAGMARFEGRAVMVLGQEKGDDTASRLKHNFGMARPEGYRKAVRAMELADRFGLPVISFVDTAGAYPGIGAEERGQAEAIARSTEACLALTVPTISVIIGEGGSGGAIALATANKVYMLEHSIYSVISPEGAASILWRDSTRASEAASALKLTATDLTGLQVIDGVIDEPLGGAHRDPAQALANVRAQISAAFAGFDAVEAPDWRADRRAKFLAIGRQLG
ncbi:MAG: acetyl-CoA carboxylase carboxyltransferase subunit alpha [Devosiaceae bacterium]|nr:acetyl-CoA carboxylase carboxyltransferase subunit alpha [Devosiaceae bacterium MH13]